MNDLHELNDGIFACAAFPTFKLHNFTRDNRSHVPSSRQHEITDLHVRSHVTEPAFVHDLTQFSRERKFAENVSSTSRDIFKLRLKPLLMLSEWITRLTATRSLLQTTPPACTFSNVQCEKRSINKLSGLRNHFACFAKFYAASANDYFMLANLSRNVSRVSRKLNFKSLLELK